jgi:hypothetical protein
MKWCFGDRISALLHVCSFCTCFQMGKEEYRHVHRRVLCYAAYGADVVDYDYDVVLYYNMYYL